MSELEQVTQYIQGIVILWIGGTCMMLATLVSNISQFSMYVGYVFGAGLMLFGNHQMSKSSLKKQSGKERVATVKKYKPSSLSSSLAFLLAIAAAIAMYKFTNFPTWLLLINMFSMFLGFAIVAQWIHLLNFRKTK